MKGKARAHPRGRQRYVYLRGECSSPLISTGAAHVPIPFSGSDAHIGRTLSKEASHD